MYEFRTRASFDQAGRGYRQEVGNSDSERLALPLSQLELSSSI